MKGRIFIAPSPMFFNAGNNLLVFRLFLSIEYTEFFFDDVKKIVLCHY